MKIGIQPLGNRKYYGTGLAVVFRGQVVPLEVWYHGDNPTPSTRQLADWGMTLEEVEREGDMTCDGHYESQDTYDIAERIVQAFAS